MGILSNLKSFLIKTTIASILVTGTFNYVVDPYGAFGDKYLNMQSYSLSNNSRIGKIDYLDKNYEKYNTYVFGGSKVGGLSPKDIDKAFGSGMKSYNMMMTEGELDTYEKTINYVIDNYKPEKIILQLSMLEMKYYGEETTAKKMLPLRISTKATAEEYFSTFLFMDLNYTLEKLEAYKNKDYKADISISTGDRKRENQAYRIETEGKDYYRKAKCWNTVPENRDLPALSKNVKAIKRIVKKCKKSGVEFMLLTAPTSNKELMLYDFDLVKPYMKEIAQICPYWCFSGYNDISYNYWNFYDTTHFRQDIGKQMLAKMTGKTMEETPENFGRYITAENAEQEIEAIFQQPSYLSSDKLLYGMGFPDEIQIRNNVEVWY